MTPPSRSRFLRCGICGSPDLEIDEVLGGGRLCLVSCPRCEYRYTENDAGAASTA